MDDDRRLDELADEPLDEHDARTVAELRALYDATDPVPLDLVDRVRFSLALDEMFDEVARMTRVPLDALAVRSEQPAGTRTETLTFSADRLTAMVTVSRVAGGQLRLDGWLAPPQAYRVRLRLQGRGQLEVLADDQGRFVFDRLEEGFGQLSFHADDDVENAVVTPLFQL
jgi:hypothetical protein